MNLFKNHQYALQSLIYSVSMGITTTVHHLHAGLILDSDGESLHLVAMEMILIPATVVSMILYLRNGNRTALWFYLLLAASGFIFLGLYEGGWNHTARLIAYLRVDSPETNIETLLPAGNLHLWFYEITGVLTLIVTLLATYYTWLFYQETRTTD